MLSRNVLPPISVGHSLLSSTMSSGSLTSARYGKDKVRVLRVVRKENVHHVVEYNVQVLLEGDLDVSYTQADNTVVVATDSMKNIVYYMAKTSPYVLSPTKFATHIGTFLVSKYAHIHKAFITVEQLRWSRIVVGQDGKQGHDHSFLRDGDEKKFVKVEVDATKGKNTLTASVTAGVTDLLVLKTTNSSFEKFIRDEFTTLPEVDDRIFSTSVDLSFTFDGPIAIPPPKNGDKLDFEVPAVKDGGVWDDQVLESIASKVTLEVFAEDNSASVQATLYKMAQALLDRAPGIRAVSYALPNKHYIPVDMSYIGVSNLKPSDAEVFMPVAAPSGLITATVTRN
ncbi:uricase [Flagelloscypha sp. PMI_526]|nr:uricase [Flagelloscypha sp. PMI_526]